MSHRVCNIVGINDEKLDRLIKEVQSFMAEEKIPEMYTVNVYKDQVTCCGHIPIGMAIEIEGPKMQQIKKLDEKIYGKINEICGREKIDHPEFSPIDIIQRIEGSVFRQGYKQTS